MKKIETNFLIYELAKKGNIKPPMSFWPGLLLMVGINIILLNLFLLQEPLREDMLDIYLRKEFYVPLWSFYVASLFGCSVCYSLVNPSKDMKFIFRFSKIAFYSAWWFLFCCLAYQVGLGVYNGDFSLNELSRRELVDYLITFAISFGILLFFTRKGYAIRVYRLIGVLCLTSFSFANVCNLFTYKQSIAEYDVMLVNIVNIPVIIIICLAYKFAIAKFKEKNKTYNVEG